MLPTLLLKGNLVPPDKNPDAKLLLDNWIPIEYVLSWFKERMHKTGIESRVLILKSETASGKSTLISPRLYDAFIAGNTAARSLICTQPRVVTAIENVVSILTHNSNLTIGKNIGWSTKHNKVLPTETGVLSATIGTLAQQLKTMSDTDFIAKYGFVIIDEVHERDLQTDLTLYLLKGILHRNASKVACPFVVLMSATFDPSSFLQYYGGDIMTNFIWCTGNSFERVLRWDWNNDRLISDYTRAAAEVVEKIINEGKDDIATQSDILIFLPGEAEFIETKGWLTKLNKQLARDDPTAVFNLLQIESRAVSSRNRDYMETLYIPLKDQEVMSDGDVSLHSNNTSSGKLPKKYKPRRRVILSTNVTETGLTLDNLKYVIDAGYNREMEYDPVFNTRSLLTKPAPKSRIHQRIGRIGRKHMGVFYPLYPKFIFDRLPELQLPRIKTEDISSIMTDIIYEQMRAKKLNNASTIEFLIDDIDLVDIPSIDMLRRGLEKMYTIGIISPCSPDFKITSEIAQQPNEAQRGILAAIDHIQDIGRNWTSENTQPQYGFTPIGLIVKMLGSFSPENARMLLGAYFWDCSPIDLITIIAWLNVEKTSLISIPTDKPTKSKDLNWEKIYALGLPGWLAGPQAIIKLRTLIADDFIDGLILFYAIKRQITANPIESIANLSKFATDCELSLDGCMAFLATRDELIENAIENNLTVGMVGLGGSDETQFINTVARIKYCIYDSYHMNLLVRDDATSQYFTAQGLTVKIPSSVSSLKPKFAIYHQLSLKSNRDTSIYEAFADKISVLDGFISPDLDYVDH
jgi:HrpA-like RNA helicase